MQRIGRDCLVSGAHLAVHHFIGLAKQRTSLAVPEHDIADEKFAEHRGAYFASKSPAPLPVHILRAEFDVLRLRQ